MKSIAAIRNSGAWNKSVRFIIKPLAWVAAALVVIWAILWIYVSLNEESIKNRIIKAIHAKTRGEVKIDKLSVSLLRTFPLLSLQLTDVTIKDSVTSFAHKDFLRASDIYLRVNVAGLITGNSPVGKILVRNGEINIESDSSGNTNEYILRIKRRQDKPLRTRYPVIELQNVSGSYKNPGRGKDYAAIIHALRCRIKDGTGILSVSLDMKLLAKNVAFNTMKGTYLKEKLIEGKLYAALNRKTKDINFNNVKLYLDNHPYYFTGRFNADKNLADFNLSITTQGVNFSQASSLLTDRIRKSLDSFSVTDPVDVAVKLSGKTKFRSVPLVEVTMDVKNNKVITPKGLFQNCSFNGFFSNQLSKDKPRNDLNSYLLFKNFKGSWENITLRSQQIKVSNLVSPFLECDVSSNVDMKTLNRLADSKSLQFLDGETSFSILFKGPITGKDSAASNINGYVKISDASIKYVPRNLLLADCEGTLRFVNNDLFVNKLNADVGKTKLVMNGTARNFLSLLNVSPEKLVLKWNITSPSLHLADFKSLLSSPTRKKAEERNGSTIARTSSRVDRMFSEGDMHISLETPAMDYKTFEAKAVHANVVFTPTEIKIERASLSHAGGTMNVKGELKNGQAYNPVTLLVLMNRMDIPELFKAFNNFGQDAITHTNMRGKLSANVTYNTGVTNKAELVAQGSEGTVNFLLEEGELINFEPLQKIGEKLKKQDFTHVKFADLKNRLDVKGNTFIVNRMDIRSTALNFSVEGVYDSKKGTDMSIKLPFRNLLKSQANTDISDQGKPARGPGLRLRAKTGDDGKLKVSWDPLKLAVKNKEEVRDSSNVRN